MMIKMVVQSVNATIGGMNNKGSGVSVVTGKFGNAIKFDGSTNAASVVDFELDQD